MVKMAATPLKTDKTGLFLGLLPGTLCIQHKSHAAHDQPDICQPESGQVKFQNNLGTVFIHVHKRTIFTFILGVAQFECMQQITYFTDVTTENFLMKRLFS